MGGSILHLSEQLGADLKQQNTVLALAESCTGGGIAQAITDVAGSSAWFDRGFVTYSNEAKLQMLGVPLVTLEQYGAVSEQTAIAMAQGALKNSMALIALSVTGIAGPDGGSDDKPVGTVWFAIATEQSVEAYLQQFDGDRHAIRQQAVEFALSQLLKAIA